MSRKPKPVVRFRGVCPQGRPIYEHPEPAGAPVGVEGFVVRHYTGTEGPTIKGNGFDGLRIGEDRNEAEEFIHWVNAALAQQPAAVQKGYKNGLDAALRTIANLGIADSEAQTNGREDAYRAVEALAAQQPAATLPDEDDSDLTVAYMAGRHDGRKEAQQPAAVDGGWRKKAAEWLESMAVEQEAANQRWPKHAACYKEWRDRPGILRHLAFQVLAAQQGGES